MDQLKRETVYLKIEDRDRLRDDTEDASEDPYIVFLIAIFSKGYEPGLACSRRSIPSTLLAIDRAHNLKKEGKVQDCGIRIDSCVDSNNKYSCLVSFFATFPAVDPYIVALVFAFFMAKS